MRNLIAAGHLPQGNVDERSIVELSACDVSGYRQAHFFAGIGGWPYALELAGWLNDREVWTGSCPCQPLSSAGQRKGHADERHLWPAFYRLIAECRPATIFGEQVASKDGREWLAGVRADLEGIGYAVGAADLCAASAGAPHIRQRLFWVADAKGGRGRAHAGAISSGTIARLQDAEGQDERWSIKRDGYAFDCGTTGGMGNASNPLGRALGIDRQDVGNGHDAGRAQAHGQPGASGEIRGLGDADDRRRRQCDASQRSISITYKASVWSYAEWLPCLDGKARRIESGTFPLVTRLPEDMGSDRSGEVSPFRVIRDPKTGKSIGQAPSRVGMLRGYGNSIVPQVAAEFVKSFLATAAAPPGEDDELPTD